MSVQYLTLKLDGITPADYLAWVRDPEPPALDLSLSSVAVEADPVDDAIHATLIWKTSAPVPALAAPLAGLPLTPEVVAVEAGGLAAAA
jgi:hypothetical protein